MESQNKALNENDRIKQLIVRVGDEGPKYHRRDINKLTTNMIATYNNGDSYTKDLIIRTFVECVSVLTSKASVYATTISLISMQNSSLAESIIDRVIDQLQLYLDKGDLHIPKSICIFLGELMNVGVLNSFVFINLLYDIFNEAEKTYQSSKDYYLWIGTSVIPFVMDGLLEKSKLEFKNLVQNIDNLISKRDTNYLNILKLFKDKTPNDRLTIMWNALSNHIQKETHTKVSSINRPYDEFSEELKNIKQIKKNIKIYFNKKKESSSIYQSPPYFSLFEEDIWEKELPDMLDRIIHKENLIDILTMFHHSKKLTLQKLQNYNSYFHVDHTLVEVIFGEMLRLPCSEVKLVFYSSLAVGLAQEENMESENSIYAILCKAANTLFHNLENLDVEGIERFSKWFNFFISNFSFKWKWNEWKYSLNLEESSIKVQFLKNTISKLVNLAYYERILEILPEEFHILVQNPQPHLQYEHVDAINHADCEVIKDKFNSKLSGEEMLNFIKSKNANIDATGELLFDIFFQTLLYKSSKSLSHLRVYLERYHKVLEYMIIKENDQIAALEAIKKVWMKSIFHINLLVDHLIQRKLISSRSAVNWIFKEITKSPEHNLLLSPFWNILFSVINKSLIRVECCKQDIAKGVTKPNENQNKLQKNLDMAIEDEESLFLLIFKRLTEAFDNSDENDIIRSTLINRGAQILRKYKNQLEGIFDKIEEEMNKHDHFELKNLALIVKDLKYTK